MAFDAEAPAALAFVTTSGALDAYRLAKLANTPGAYRDAAHKLAAALETARPAASKPVLRVWLDVTDSDAFAWGYDGGSFQFSGFHTAHAAREDALAAHPAAAIRWVDADASRLRSAAHEAWLSGDVRGEFASDTAAKRADARADAGATRRPRKPKADGLNLAAPIANVPKTKRVAGAFVCRWADGSETRVSGVLHHVAKPEGRWAAAFQAGDRLRRMRAGSDLARRNHFPGHHIAGACGVSQRSPVWLAFEAARPMPQLVEILCENTADVHTPQGVYGAGDAAETERLEHELARVQVRATPAPRAIPQADCTGVVVQLRPATEVKAALSRLADAETAHGRAQRTFADLLGRTDQTGGTALAAAYEEECLAFAILREAQRDAAKIAA